MRFQVPQFIEVEDKIFGPLTFKQFIYLAGAGGISFVFWTLLPKFLAILVSAPIVMLALALAFYKVNNRPFINVLESALSFMTKDKLYVWRQEKKKSEEKKVEEPVAQSNIRVPKLSGSKLKDLAWSLDIKESIYSDENQQK
ncbi:PrgI family protein [Patescibacteria group bacterium]|nr:PrgI family protein [Patescibacteria group bacterium]